MSEALHDASLITPGFGADALVDNQRLGLSPFMRTNNKTHHLDLLIRGARCGGCLSKIEKAVRALDGVLTARMNLSSGQLSVSWKGALQADSIGETITALGYDIAPYMEDHAEATRHREERNLLIALGIAGFCMANIMLLSVSVWSGHGEMSDRTRQIMHAISGLIALPAMIFSGSYFFRSAFASLKRRKVNMDVPVSLALILAFSVSVLETLSGGHHAYFDACVMLMFFLLLGRFLDERLRRRAYSAAHNLAAMQNQTVRRWTATGHEDVRASEIAPGDLLLLAVGERALVDMQVETGDSEIDESLVSGETLPRTIAQGSTLYSGSVNLSAPITGRALSAAQDSLLSDIARLMDAGEQRRSSYLKLADKAVSFYVPFVHATAALAFSGWLIAGAPLAKAVMIAVATLIITCPCALALAAPVTQIVAASRLFSRGVFINAADGLERLAEIDTVVFDKTGTLTIGQPCWIETDDSRAFLPMAAALARTSRHPLSKALASAATGSPQTANHLTEEPGKGVSGQVNGVECRLGSAVWVGATAHVSHEGPIVWFRTGDNTPIPFLFSDVLKPDAKSVIERLHDMGMRVEILSGDRAETVATLADNLGIAHWKAEVTPQSKVAHLEDLRAQGRLTLMIGDGINDAAALSYAHASLTPGAAMDISKSAADAVFTGELGSVGDICQIARRSRQVMQQNFSLASLYNVIAVPIAVAGFATPLVAAIAMSMSSLIVTLNALRLNLSPLAAQER